MRCPFCGDLQSSVVDSRVTKEEVSIRRRRECSACGKRFTTYERVEEVTPFVIKKDGTRAPIEWSNGGYALKIWVHKNQGSPF